VKDTVLGCLTARRDGLVSSKHEPYQGRPSKLKVVNTLPRFDGTIHRYCAAPFSAERRTWHFFLIEQVADALAKANV
jgi:hypothetical protein